MIALIVMCTVPPLLWFAFEMYRAPLAVETPRGLHVIEPGRRLDELIPARLGRHSPVRFWGVA